MRLLLLAFVAVVLVGTATAAAAAAAGSANVEDLSYEEIQRQIKELEKQTAKVESLLEWAPKWLAATSLDVQDALTPHVQTVGAVLKTGWLKVADLLNTAVFPVADTLLVQCSSVVDPVVERVWKRLDVVRKWVESRVAAVLPQSTSEDMRKTISSFCGAAVLANIPGFFVLAFIVMGAPSVSDVSRDMGLLQPNSPWIKTKNSNANSRKGGSKKKGKGGR